MPSMLHSAPRVALLATLVAFATLLPPPAAGAEPRPPRPPLTAEESTAAASDYQR